MLKTTEQHTAPSDVGSEHSIEVAGAQSVLATTDDHVLEPESLESIQTLIDEFSSEAKKRKRQWWTMWGVMVGSILPLAGLTFFAISRVHSGHWWFVVASLTLQLLSPFLFHARCLSFSRPSKRQQAIIDRVAKSNDVRAISPLLGGLGTTNKAARRLVVGALIPLLPHGQDRSNAWLGSPRRVLSQVS